MRAAWVLAASAALLSGCQQEMQVTVSWAGSVPVFSVSATKPPCIDSLMIAIDGVSDDLAWNIASSDSNNCVTRFTYGVVPPGFSQIGGPPAPLVAGKTYRVSIDRPGAMGLASFTVPAGSSR